MAIGDDAKNAGYGLVPDTGEEGRVKWGARELNRTRDYIARVLTAVRPVATGGTGANNKKDARTNLGFRSGTAGPSGGEDGDVYYQIIG